MKVYPRTEEVEVGGQMEAEGGEAGQGLTVLALMVGRVLVSERETLSSYVPSVTCSPGAGSFGRP